MDGDFLDIYDVTQCDHMISGSCEFTDNSFSLEVTVLSSLVAIDLAKVKTSNFSFVT